MIHTTGAWHSVALVVTGGFWGAFLTMAGVCWRMRDRED